jgi:3'-5' exoribonuclease
VPHRNIADLSAGDTLKQFFLLRRVDRRLTKDNKPYVDVELADRSGTIKGKIWDDVLQKCPGPLAPCDFVAITGVVKIFQGVPQITVEFIDTVERLKAMGRPLEEFDPDLLMAPSPFNREEMWGNLLDLVNSHMSPPLRDLVLALLHRYKSQFLEWPGSKYYHHAYLGGLLEHTWSITRHALRSLEVYPDLNGDLVLAGAILHDLGKIRELTGPLCPERSVPGELLGHIVLGWEMIREEARALEFHDEHLLLSLEHIIIAHHGAVEFGSPVLPRTPEALLVYYLDEIDAKLHMARKHLDTDPSDGCFTSYLKGLGRSLYRPPDLLANPPEASLADDS